MADRAAAVDRVLGEVPQQIYLMEIMAAALTAAAAVRGLPVLGELAAAAAAAVRPKRRQLAGLL
jgi:hypothetical protein